MVRRDATEGLVPQAAGATGARYADDFVVMCRTKKQCDQAEERLRAILERLGLELHPEKTRRVELYDGKEGFDFLGCHLHKRVSGRLLEEKGERLYFLQRWPSQRSMQRIRQRVKELTPRSRCHADIRDVIVELNPILRRWGNYSRTGNAAQRFNQLNTYVWRRLIALRLKRKGRHLRPGEVERWSRDYSTTSASIACAAPSVTRTSPFWGGAHNAATRETTGKPCAGNPHARFERGSCSLCARFREERLEGSTNAEAVDLRARLGRRARDDRMSVRKQ